MRSAKWRDAVDHRLDRAGHDDDEDSDERDEPKGCSSPWSVQPWRLRAELEQAQVATISGPADRDWGMRTLTLADPGGYT